MVASAFVSPAPSARDGENATKSSLRCINLPNFTYVTLGKDQVFLSDKRLSAAGVSAAATAPALEKQKSS